MDVAQLRKNLRRKRRGKNVKRNNRQSLLYSTYDYIFIDNYFNYMVNNKVIKW